MPATGLLLLVALLPSLGLAGWQSSGIVNGEEAVPHSKPYMVSVQSKRSHICGGFLVSESFVMTAAHCLKWGMDLTVVLGAHDLTKKEKTTRIGSVKFYHIYPGFNNKTLDNDIALLQLDKAVQQSKAIQWISLPKKDKEVKSNSVCSVAGWGAVKEDGKGQPRLMETNVTIVDRKVCRTAWKSITTRMMCAGGNEDNRGFCKGDSGGPLVCKNTAEGIVSFYLSNCESSKKPNVYTQVSKFLTWIKCIMKNV